MKWLFPILGLIQLITCDNSNPLKVSVQGRVVLPASHQCNDFSRNAKVSLSPGTYIGFIKGDCTFSVDNVSPGSYIVQIDSTDFVFEPHRVDITKAGKMRSRKLALISPNSVTQTEYPLKMAAKSPTRYFRKREEWRISDMLFSPMVIMMVLPLLVMLVIPKMTANDPELKKEMEQMQLPKMDMPDMSEMMANFFGNSNQPTKKKPISSGNVQRRR